MEKAMQQEETLAKEEAVEVELPAEEEKEEESQKEKLEVVEEQLTEDKSEKLLLGLKKYKKRMKNLRKKPILLIQQCFLNMTIEYLLS
jgi:hypothetical protein